MGYIKKFAALFSSVRPTPHNAARPLHPPQHFLSGHETRSSHEHHQHPDEFFHQKRLLDPSHVRSRHPAQAEVWHDAVCDFSLGNPDLAPPPAVGKALAEFVKHVDEPFSLGYMPNNGFGWAREKLAAHLSKEQGAELTANDVILTCGAAGALNVIFRTVLEPGDEVLTVTPYFVEYGSYVGNHGGTLKKVPTLPGTFGLDLPAIEAVITPKTRAMIINSPHNPTGTVYSREELEGLTASSPRPPNAMAARSIS